MPSECRAQLEREEAVEACRRGLRKLGELANSSNLVDDEVLMMVLRDNVYRGEEALRQAIERTKDAV